MCGGRPPLHLLEERAEGKGRQGADSGQRQDKRTREPGVQDFGVGATHPLTSKLSRSSGSAVAAEVAMSSECDFWSRAMGSGCDVITAIRADCGGCKSAQRARRDMKRKRRLIGRKLRWERRSEGDARDGNCGAGALRQRCTTGRLGRR